jgi:fucose permease
MIKNVKAITASAYLSMLFLGVGSSIVGAAARNIGLSPYQIGLLISIQNVGFAIAVLVTGALADIYDKPKLLLAGSLILSISFFIFYRSGIFWANLAIMLAIGLGIGTYEGVSDAMLLQIHSRRQSLHININHFFVTFGSITITAYLIFLQMDWRRSLTQAAAVVFGLSIFFAFTKLKDSGKGTESYLDRLKILTRERLVAVMFTATILVVGIESTTTGILTTFLMDARGLSQVTSKIGLILFLSGMATGRLLLGLLTRDEHITRVILGLFSLSVLVFSALFFLHAGVVVYPLIFLAGLSMSALFPLILSLAGIIYPQMAGTVLGAIKVAIPVGGIVVPFVLSMVSKYINFQSSLAVLPIAFALAFGILFYEIRGMRTIEPAAAD